MTDRELESAHKNAAKEVDALRANGVRDSDPRISLLVAKLNSIHSQWIELLQAKRRGDVTDDGSRLLIEKTAKSVALLFGLKPAFTREPGEIWADYITRADRIIITFPGQSVSNAAAEKFAVRTAHEVLQSDRSAIALFELPQEFNESDDMADDAMPFNVIARDGQPAVQILANLCPWSGPRNELGMFFPMY